MHVIADTNIVVSGLLWHGPPRQVLQRPEFAQRLARADVTPHTLVLGYAALARLVVPAAVGPVVEADPDDDAVLACAVAARAEVIVSGDRDLLALASYAGIAIITAARLMARVVAA